MPTVTITIIAFIGAFAGLFGRLYSEAQIEKAIDDYKLALARLMITPLLSGLIALIGVLVITGINTVVSGFLLPIDYFIAAIFGLMPNLLINQLQKRSNGYTAALQSIQPTSGR
jgi:H+/Cl- antiporter ClcA